MNKRSDLYNLINEIKETKEKLKECEEQYETYKRIAYHIALEYGKILYSNKSEDFVPENVDGYTVLFDIAHNTFTVSIQLLEHEIECTDNKIALYLRSDSERYYHFEFNVDILFAAFDEIHYVKLLFFFEQALDKSHYESVDFLNKLILEDKISNEECGKRYSEMVTNYKAAKKRIGYLVAHNSEIELYDILKKENLLKKGE